MWTYNDQPVESIPEDYVGFVYLITEIPTGMKYIGKKLFRLKGFHQVKGKRKRLLKESDWKSYYGSSDNLKLRLQQLGEDQFKREILYMCATKGEMSYLEAKEQFDRNVLLRDDYYNGIINCRINAKHLPKRIINEFHNLHQS